MLFSTQGRHVESRTNMSVARLGDTRFFMDAFAGIEGARIYMSVARLGDTRFFMDAFAGIEGARIEPRELHPLAVGKPLRQQQQLAHQRDGAGLGDALDAREQLERTLKVGVFLD